MIFKTSQSSTQEKKLSALDKINDYPTLDDIMGEQDVPINTRNTVHRRRDLDSLG